MTWYAIGDATLPRRAGGQPIVHVVNGQGGWGRGFVLALSARYPLAERAYRRWARRPAPDDPPLQLGQVQFVPVAADPWVANLLAQHRYRTPDNPVPLRYDALASGVDIVADFAARRGLTACMPRIGAGLAGGDWDEIARLTDTHLRGSEVIVYDLAPRQ